MLSNSPTEPISYVNWKFYALVFFFLFLWNDFKYVELTDYDNEVLVLLGKLYGSHND